MNWFSYVLSGALILLVAYLILWPEEARTPAPAPQPQSAVPAPPSPEREAARLFAERHAPCHRIVSIQRVSDARPVFRIECVDSDGRAFAMQFASSDQGPTGR